jgi:hypothetical protein
MIAITKESVISKKNQMIKQLTAKFLRSFLNS